MPRMYREIVWEDEEKYSPPPNKMGLQSYGNETTRDGYLLFRPEINGDSFIIIYTRGHYNSLTSSHIESFLE